MNRTKKTTMLAALACTAALCGGVALAAEESQGFTLDDVVVTATRTENKLADTPANVTVITAEKMADRHYVDVAEALRDVPGASITDIGTGASEKKITLNGDARVLVLVDGRRVNFEMGVGSGRGSYDLNQLPDISTIERIEVVKGHGGSLYGSDAVGGVVNIITKKADHNYGKISFGVGSEQAREAKAMYAFKKDKTSVMVSFSKYKQGYFKYKDAATGDTMRWPGSSTYENEKISVKVKQELSATTNLEIGYDFSKYDGIRSTDISYSPSSSYKKTNVFYAKYDWLWKGKDQGYIHIYRNALDYYNWGNMDETDTGFEVQQAITTGDNNKLVVGASYRKGKAFNHLYYTKEQSINNKAIFVNDQWEFLPSWTLNAGVRYDHHSVAGGKTTWSAGLNKKLDRNSHVYFNWGQVFKAPTIDDLYYYSPGGEYEYGGQTYKYGGYYGDPDLKPEKGYTWTLGYGTKIADKTEVNVSYFQSDLTDAINWEVVGIDRYVSNIDKQKKNGFELSVKHELNKNWDLEASYSYVRVRNSEAGKDYVRDWNYIPNMYRLGARFHTDRWSVSAFLRGGSGADTSVHMKDGRSTQAYVDSSYITLDMSANYKATKNLSFYAKGYNLLNKAYTETAGVTNGTYTYPAAGCHFLIGAEYTF